MKNLLLINLFLALATFVKAQHIETTIKIVNGKARIVVKLVGGTITGQVSNVIFGIAIPAKNNLITLEPPTILDASRLPVKLVISAESYMDSKYRYFNLSFISLNKSVTYVKDVEYELLELNWKGGEGQDFPVTLISFEDNPGKSTAPFSIINYFEIGGKQYSTGDHLFYQSATSSSPVQMASDYSSGTASVTSEKVSSKPMITAKNHSVPRIAGLFPNPASAEVNVIIDAPGRGNVTLVVSDIYGKTVKQKAANVETGSNTIPVDISALAKGSYLVKVLCKSSDCETAVSKFVKQ